MRRVWNTAVPLVALLYGGGAQETGLPRHKVANAWPIPAVLGSADCLVSTNDGSTPHGLRDRCAPGCTLPLWCWSCSLPMTCVGSARIADGAASWWTGFLPAMQMASPVRGRAETLPVVVFYGDSTQRGDLASGKSGVSEARNLLAGRAILRNDGVGGSYARQFLDGEDGHHLRWTQELRTAESSAIFVNFGINDAYIQTTQEYEDALRHLVAGARAAGRRLVLQTPSPVTRTRGYPLGQYQANVQTMRRVAAETGTYLCDVHAAVAVAGLADQTVDGVHPNTRMYRAIGVHIAQCVREVLAGS